MNRATKRPKAARGPWNAVVTLVSLNRRDNPRTRLLLIDGRKHRDVIEVIAAAHLGVPYLIITGEEAAEVLAILEHRKRPPKLGLIERQLRRNYQQKERS